MRRKQLLFATFDDDRLDEGFVYAVELARTLDKDLRVLLVSEKKLSEKLDDLMAAVAFAEDSDPNSAREMVRGGIMDAEAPLLKKLTNNLNKARMSGVGVEVFTAAAKITQAVNDFIKQNPGVDMVLLGPTVTDAGSVSARELKKLVTSVSKPVVTMARHAYGD